MKISIVCICTASALMLSAGCLGSQRTLAPAPSARLSAGDESAVVDEDAGVRGVAQVEAWDGNVSLRSAVTPIKVVLENRAERAVVVRLEHFTLQGESTRRYRALQPTSISGVAPMLQATPTNPPTDRSVGHSVFDTPRGQRASYPTIYTSAGPFPTHTGIPTMDQRLDGYVELPTPHMLNSAIVEGKLGPDGHDVGFVYFEPLPVDETGFELRIDLPDETGDERLARLRFPFVVDD